MVEHGLTVGLTGEYKRIVTPDVCALREYLKDDFFVFSTPEMIKAMEIASINAIIPQLPDHIRSVGTMVNIKHLRATPLEDEITTKAELIRVDGDKLHYTVEAYSSTGLIGKGEHGRYVIDMDDFLANVPPRKN